MEIELWARLYRGLREKNQSTHSRQSSGSDSIDESERIKDVKSKKKNFDGKNFDVFGNGDWVWYLVRLVVGLLL